MKHFLNISTATWLIALPSSVFILIACAINRWHASLYWLWLSAFAAAFVLGVRAWNRSLEDYYRHDDD